MGESLTPQREKEEEEEDDEARQHDGRQTLAAGRNLTH